ncbi:hypothetical protein P171DRAFT_488106 [Karstenula rhodostoma CBS 690.94]|uniref:Rhodopsin domain-containing protein n=1 Tax=Karstenula rhodostoma CBS 690.94 TaxID=1392251 RepID=A0A9P4PCV1_9PLEO|nr:hypothetical protein P171DRAFT_488106 [Karstenula rhodostoma CBS 690.94]
MIPKLADSGYPVFVATSVFVAVATIAFGLRAWARLLIGAWGIDDWLMLVGWLLFLSQPIMTPFSRVGSYHSHDPAEAGISLTIAEYESGLKWRFFIDLLYTVNTTIIKCSICCLMLRIVRHNTHRRIFKGVIYISIIGALVRIIVWVARCEKFEDNWRDPHNFEKGASCSSQKLLTDVSIFFSSICIATDFVCAIFPAFFVRELHMCYKQKVYLSIMLGLGLFASIATITRVPFLVRYQDPDEFLAKLPPIAILSNLEIMLGIIGACIATMRPLLRFIPSLGAEMMSFGSQGTPNKVYRMCHMGTESGIQEGQQNDMDRIGSRALMLPQRPPSAQVKDETAGHVYMCRQFPTVADK